MKNKNTTITLYGTSTFVDKDMNTADVYVKLKDEEEIEVIAQSEFGKIVIL